MYLKQISRVRTSNHIPQILWDVITCPCPWFVLLAPQSPMSIVLGRSVWFIQTYPSSLLWDIDMIISVHVTLVNMGKIDRTWKGYFSLRNSLLGVITTEIWVNTDSVRCLSALTNVDIIHAMLMFLIPFLRDLNVVITLLLRNLTQVCWTASDTGVAKLGLTSAVKWATCTGDVANRFMIRWCKACMLEVL